MGTVNAATLKGKEEDMVIMMEQRSPDLLGIYERRVQESGSKIIYYNTLSIYKGNNQERNCGMAMSWQIE